MFLQIKNLTTGKEHNATKEISQDMKLLDAVPYTRNHIFERNRWALASSKNILSIQYEQI